MGMITIPFGLVARFRSSITCDGVHTCYSPTRGHGRCCCRSQGEWFGRQDGADHKKGTGERTGIKTLAQHEVGLHNFSFGRPHPVTGKKLRSFSSAVPSRVAHVSDEQNVILFVF